MPRARLAMDVADLALRSPWPIAGWVLALALLAVTAWRGEWARIRDEDPVHAYLATIAALVGLWSLRGDAGGFAFHLLGSAALALAAGPWRALAGGALVVAFATWLRDAPVANAACVWLTLVVVPVAVVTGILRAAERWLPPNFFVYVFVASFAGAALALLAGGLAGAALSVLAAGRPADLVFGEHAPFLLYLAFAEATLTGMAITLAVVYRPGWVATFDDRRYLARRP